MLDRSLSCSSTTSLFQALEEGPWLDSLFNESPYLATATKQDIYPACCWTDTSDSSCLTGEKRKEARLGSLLPPLAKRHRSGAESYKMVSSPTYTASEEDMLGFLDDIFEVNLEASMEQAVSSSIEVTGNRDSEEETKDGKSREKWTDEELQRLWQGIYMHGNNWTAIRGTCLGRSYCQIKDKGRRCLFKFGWKTGRTKDETLRSGLHAQRIASKVLSELSFSL